MAADIKIKGLRDLIRVESSFVLKEKWQDYVKTKRDSTVSIPGWTGKLSSIDYVKDVTESNSNNKSSEDVHTQYLKDLREIRLESPEVRAKRMGFFRLVYFGFTGKKSEEIQTNSGIPIEILAEDIQRKFFEENPKRVVCDAVLYHPLIKSKGCDESVVRVIERTTYQDKFAEVNIA